MATTVWQINRNCLLRTKAREKETDNQKLMYPKMSGPSRGKRSGGRYFKILSWDVL